MYVRMLFVMAVSLYTSRVILNTLGVEDYGTYQVVGGVVGLLAFVNGTLSRGTSRFLLFEMGSGSPTSIAKLFSTLLNAHIILALIIIVLAETLGLWFVYHKLVIPEDRMGPALLAYHLSIITVFFTLTQAPFSAAIKSHERFDIYAYTSIVDVLAKLSIAYAIQISPVDKLAFYAILLFLTSVGMTIFLRAFCMRHFEETRYLFVLDIELLKKVTSYCSWNLFSSISGVLNSQGLIVLVNMFFNSGVVTSMAIANTVKNAANSFVQNFRLASIPQTVKSYASGDHEQSKSLLMNTTKYSYFLLFLLSLPVFLVAPEVLKIWLGFIPESADTFLRFIILVAVFQLFDSCFYTALDVIGQIKRYSIIYPILMLANIFTIYICFRCGMPAVSYAIVTLITYIILSLVLLPILVVTQTEYTYKEIYHLYFHCLYVTILALIIPVIAYIYLPPTGVFLRIVILSIISVCSVCISVWYLGIDHKTQMKIVTFINRKIHHK